MGWAGTKRLRFQSSNPVRLPNRRQAASVVRLPRVPSGSVATEALSIGELKPMAIFRIAMKDVTGKEIAVTGKAFFDVDHAPAKHSNRRAARSSTWVRNP